MGISVWCNLNYNELTCFKLFNDVIIYDGLSASTISATTYQNLPTDIRVTGGTYSNGTAIFTNNTGGTFNVVGFFTGYTNVVNSLTTGLGLSADTTIGDITIINTAPDQVVSLTQGTNITISGTYPNFTISATDVYVSGGTYDNNTGTATFTNTSGGTFNVSGFTTGGTSSSLTFNEVQRIAFLGIWLYLLTQLIK